MRHRALIQVNIMSMMNAESPKNKTEPRSFVGVCDIYRSFILRLTNTPPLNQLLRKNKSDTCKLDENQLVALDKFIEVVRPPPILDIPQPNLQYSIYIWMPVITEQASKYSKLIVMENASQSLIGHGQSSRWKRTNTNGNENALPQFGKSTNSAYTSSTRSVPFIRIIPPCIG